VEKTLSIHSIFTWRREAFYWMVVLWTFALGTSTGDTWSEDDELGYWRAFLIVLSALIFDYLLFLLLEKLLGPKPWIGITTFWIAYVLTRPLGATMGDFLTQPGGIQYDPTACTDIGTNETDVGCVDPDVYCITVCDSYPVFDNCSAWFALDNTTMCCPDPTLTCPPGWIANTCGALQPTCFTPLACDYCWGLDGALATNICFGIAFIALVAYLTWSKKDQLKAEETKETRAPEKSQNGVEMDKPEH